MLIVFKSAASGDIITFEKNAREMLAVLGKDRDEGKGIVTVDQLPAAIDRLKQAIAEDSARHAAAPDDETPAASGAGDGVSFHQRAVPLLDMLERALKDAVPVTWGV